MKNSDSKVLLFLMSLRNAADNKEHINTSDFCAKFRIGKQYATVAKNTGLISQKRAGVYEWTGGNDINAKTVKELKRAVNEYSHNKKEQRVNPTSESDPQLLSINKKLDLILNFLNLK